MNENERIVLDFIGTWTDLDVDKIVDFFAPDGVYHNIPTGPVRGHANLKAFIAGFIKDWSQVQWEIVNLVGDGELVVAERVDRMLVGDRPVELPCCGVFMLEHGKITMWRDYFDLATYRDAVAQPSTGSAGVS